MRIAIFQIDLGVGGIQRSLVSLLCSGVFDGCDVDLYLFEKNQDYGCLSLPGNVEIKYLKHFPKIACALPFDLLPTLRLSAKFIAGCPRYDVAIDYNGYSPETAAYALSVPAGKRVIWVHNDYRERLKSDTKFKVMFRAFKSKFVRFDDVVAVSEGVEDSIRYLIGDTLGRVHVIQNYIDTAAILRLAEQNAAFHVDTNCTNIVCVGRLDKTKNPIGVLREFAEAAEKNENLRLYFLGKGPLEKSLRRAIGSLGLAERVFLLGAQSNPYPYMAKMDVLLLDSWFEGQGVVLREAETLGLSLVFPKRLEKYNDNLVGCDCVSEALAGSSKKRDTASESRLETYNAHVTSEIIKLLKGIE